MPWTATPDEAVIARPVCCARCQAAFAAADHTLIDRYDKIELPKVTPVVTRVELYAGHCQARDSRTLAPLPEGLEQGSPFSLNIVALALYLRFTHAISYKRLSRRMLELSGLAISEGALDSALQRAKPRFDAEVSAILARLRRARVVCSDETSVRVDGRICWNWVFQNSEVVIHVIRHSRGAGVVREGMAGHRPALWVSDLYSAQQGHAADWPICLAHQLRDCQFAIEAGDAIFAPRWPSSIRNYPVTATPSQIFSDGEEPTAVSRNCCTRAACCNDGTSSKTVRRKKPCSHGAKRMAFSLWMNSQARSPGTAKRIGPATASWGPLHRLS